MATLLPPGKIQFLDSDGKPLSGASVAFYTPGTSDFKDTYQDAGATILNTNPVILDAAGEAVVYGTGAYRQVVTDAAGNLIWDQETSEPGSQIDSITVGGDLSVSGTSALNRVTISGDLSAVNATTSGGLHVSGDFATDGLCSLNGTTNTQDLNCGGSFTAFGNVGITGTTTFGPVVDAIDLNVHGSMTAFGNVQIDGSAHANTLYIDGSFSGSASGWQMDSSGTGAFNSGYNLGINAGAGVIGTTFIAASDARIKVNVADVPFADAHRFVRSMRAKVFMKDGAPDAGFIAQDAIVNGFQRMVVVTNTDDPRMSHGDDVSPIGKRLNLNYTYATAYHHRMIDYLLDRVDDLQKQISLLKN